MKRSQIKLVPQPDGDTCQSASIAILAGTDDVSSIRKSLLAHGVPGDPSNINAELKYRVGSLGTVRLDTQCTFGRLLEGLTAGCAAILQGYFTYRGHVIVATGRPEHGFIKVLDPWTEFQGHSFSYVGSKSYGYSGMYSDALIYSTCFESKGYNDAQEVYRQGAPGVVLNGPTGWVHWVGYSEEPHAVDWLHDTYGGPKGGADHNVKGGRE
jgi:hypothetical protein